MLPPIKLIKRGIGRDKERWTGLNRNQELASSDPPLLSSCQAIGRVRLKENNDITYVCLLAKLGGVVCD